MCVFLVKLFTYVIKMNFLEHFKVLIILLYTTFENVLSLLSLEYNLCLSQMS